jgi:hypothetical protein
MLILRAIEHRFVDDSDQVAKAVAWHSICRPINCFDPTISVSPLTGVGLEIIIPFAFQMAETAQNHPETVPPPVVTDAAEPAVTPDELSADETHLQSIFPDLDSATIHDCYVLCDRNVERTVEFLLGDVRHPLFLE